MGEVSGNVCKSDMRYGVELVRIRDAGRDELEGLMKVARECSGDVSGSLDFRSMNQSTTRWMDYELHYNVQLLLSKPTLLTLILYCFL